VPKGILKLIFSPTGPLGNRIIISLYQINYKRLRIMNKIETYVDKKKNKKNVKL
jgi:hypothetical protein